MEEELIPDFEIRNNACDEIYYLSSPEINNEPDNSMPFVKKYGNVFFYYEHLFENIKKLSGKDADTNKNIFISLIFDNYGVELTETIVMNLKKMNKYIKEELFLEILKQTPFPNYNCYISKYGKDSQTNIKIVCGKFLNRPETSITDKIKICLLYAPIYDFLNHGNQFSTFSDNLMKIVKNGGGGIEAFGSAFNT